MSFTDIDTSLSLGLSIKGTPWGRPDDRVGIAGAWNNISATTAPYLAAGGLGPLVGDGPLSYASENVFEAYYAFQLAKGIVATADYQFLGNPGYNIVRGPVSVFSGRLSMRFRADLQVRSCSLLGARHSSGAIFASFHEDARPELRAPSHERTWGRAPAPLLDARHREAQAATQTLDRIVDLELRAELPGAAGQKARAEAALGRW